MLLQSGAVDQMQRYWSPEAHCEDDSSATWISAPQPPLMPPPPLPCATRMSHGLYPLAAVGLQGRRRHMRPGRLVPPPGAIVAKERLLPCIHLPRPAPVHTGRFGIRACYVPAEICKTFSIDLLSAQQIADVRRDQGSDKPWTPRHSALACLKQLESGG